MSQLRWQGAAALPPAAADALLGRGAPFELVTAPVLGHESQVGRRVARNRPLSRITARHCSMV